MADAAVRRVTAVLGLEDLPAGLGPSAVTIGKFDGVHLGHAALLERVRRIASDRGLMSVAITFDRNPLSLFRPDAAPPELDSLPRKLELLEAQGLDAVVVARFDAEFAARSPQDFVETILVAGLGARVVVIGPDFRFGARGAGDGVLLAELGAAHGFEVVVADPVTDETGERISASRVRAALAEGDIPAATALLGRPPVIRSEVVYGERRGRTLGYPTANLSPAIEGCVPADGVYAAWLIVDGARYGAAVSIGNNPTFGGVPEHQVEAHAFDQSFDLYGRTVELEFVQFIRGMRKFADAGALAQQMRADEERIRGILGVPGRG